MFIHDHEARTRARLEAGEDADGAPSGSEKREDQPKKRSKAERSAT